MAAGHPGANRGAPRLRSRAGHPSALPARTAKRFRAPGTDPDG